MRRWLLSSLALFLVVLAGLRYVYREDFRAAAAERLKNELRAAILPRFELHEAGFPEAVKYLEEQARLAGVRKSVKFVGLAEPEVRQAFRRQISTKFELPPELLGESGKSSNERPAHEKPMPLTISLTQIPVLHAAMYVASFANRKLRFDEGQVQFVEVPAEGTIEPFVEKRWQVPSGFIRSSGTAERQHDARTLLEANGLTFYEGSSARYEAQTNTITLVNIQEQIDLMDTLMSVGGVPPPLSPLDRVLFWFRSWLPQPAAPPMPATNPTPPPIPGL